MKFTLWTGISLAVAGVSAFPSNLLNGELSARDLARIDELAAQISAMTTVKRDLKPRFDAKAQRVETSGDHAFIAPGPKDLRGPCPGLNALANHGYISRSGVSSVLDLIEGSVKGFGMGTDLATVLAVYAGVMAGDLTSCSIGGPPPSGLIGSLGLLGKPQGLSNSHNRFEADCSPTRGDLYLTGEAVHLDMSIFQRLWDMPLGANGYDREVMLNWRRQRFSDSVSTNPNFWSGPFTGISVQTATHLFTYQFFANHSEAYPEGYLDGETLKSFESVTGTSGNFKYTPGHERFPNNWYRRAVGNEYGVAAFAADVVDFIDRVPELIIIGGNTGKTNTFTGVNIGDLTGGVYNADRLLQGNNALCLSFQVISLATPDLLRGLIGNVAQAVQKLAGPLTTVLQTLGCPSLAKFDRSLFDQFPGAQGGI